MDFERLEELKQKHADAVQSYKDGITAAQLKVDITEAKISEVRRQLLALGGQISHDAAKERQRLGLLVNDLKRELNERQTALAVARLGGDTEALENILP